MLQPHHPAGPQVLDRIRRHQPTPDQATSRCWRTSSSTSGCVWRSGTPRLARATLAWCGRDLDRHPELLRDYVENTSPVTLIDHGDDTVDSRHGTVIPGREGEAWFLDEFGGFGKVGLFAAPTAELAAALDTNPRRATLVTARDRAGIPRLRRGTIVGGDPLRCWPWARRCGGAGAPARLDQCRGARLDRAARQLRRADRGLLPGACASVRDQTHATAARSVGWNPETWAPWTVHAWR